MKILWYLILNFIFPKLEYPFSTSQAKKTQNRINIIRLFARFLMLGLFVLGGVLVAKGSNLKNTELSNIGIGILASGLVSLIFLAYEGYNEKIAALRSRANFLDSLSRFIYNNIPEIRVIGEPEKTYLFSDYIHLQHRQFHDYYKMNDLVDSEGKKLFHALTSYIFSAEDRIQALFSDYSFLALQTAFDKRELGYFLGFRDSFQRTRSCIQRKDFIRAIYNFSIYLELISNIVRYIEEMKVFNKIAITFDESGQATFNRTEFYACEEDYERSDEFIARRAANYAEMRLKEKASTDKE